MRASNVFGSSASSARWIERYVAAYEPCSLPKPIRTGTCVAFDGTAAIASRRVRSKMLKRIYDMDYGLEDVRMRLFRR